MVDVALYNHIDLFHVHYAIPHAAVAFQARSILREMGLYIPVVTTLHGTDITIVGQNRSLESVVRFSIEQSDGVTTVSDYMRNETIARFGIENPIKVIPNFVDLDRFSRQNKDHFRKMITAKGEKVVLHTSNFRKVKRIDDVISAFALVREKISAKLLMVGDGPERRPAEDRAREMGLQDDILFLGNQNAVEELYSIGDVFMLPSENEAFGLSALEAMACGVPVVASNAGGLPELVIHGQTGFVSNVGDVEDLAKNTLYLLEDHDRWLRFSQQARTHAEDFEQAQLTRHYEQYYEEVIETAKTHPVSLKIRTFTPQQHPLS
jgi:N-acetyl-alpha-D-glucosaminyl L-malate synthase BshA